MNAHHEERTTCRAQNHRIENLQFSIIHFCVCHQRVLFNQHVMKTALAVLARRTTMAVLRRPLVVLRPFSVTIPKPPHVIRMPAHDLPKSFAVEGRTTDVEQESDLDAVEHIQNFTGISEHPTAAQSFAVDAPDGESDDIHDAEVHEVEEIIDFAAEHEDKEQVIRRHDMEEQTRRAIREGHYYGYW